MRGCSQDFNFFWFPDCLKERVEVNILWLGLELLPQIILSSLVLIVISNISFGRIPPMVNKKFFHKASFYPKFVDQVLPRENGVRYPWNFLFSKCFWKGQKIKSDHSSIFEVHNNEKDSNEIKGFLGKDNIKPAMETISLDMKQQELDSRYVLRNFIGSVCGIMINNCFIVSQFFFDL